MPVLGRHLGQLVPVGLLGLLLRPLQQQQQVVLLPNALLMLVVV